MVANKWLLILLFCPLLASSQVADSTYSLNKKRLRAFTIGGTVAYSVTLVGLNHLWYSDAESQAFRFSTTMANGSRLTSSVISFPAIISAMVLQELSGGVMWNQKNPT